MTIKDTYQKSKESLIQVFGKNYFQDVTSLLQMGLSLLIIVALFLVLIFKIKPTTSLIPLVYNSTFGVTDLGAWYNIYFYPLSFAGFCLINFAIAWSFFDKRRLITYLVLFVNNIIGVLLFIEVYYLTVIIKG